MHFLSSPRGVRKNQCVLALGVSTGMIGVPGLVLLLLVVLTSTWGGFVPCPICNHREHHDRDHHPGGDRTGT